MREICVENIHRGSREILMKYYDSQQSGESPEPAGVVWSAAELRHTLSEKVRGPPVCVCVFEEPLINTLKYDESLCGVLVSTEGLPDVPENAAKDAS